MTPTRKKGYTLTEILIASVIMLAILTPAAGAYVFVRSAVGQSLLKHELNKEANTILARMIRGLKEGSTAYGIRPARSFSIPSATELRYVGIDGNTRRIYLNGNSLVYESPTQSPTSRVLYTAPAGGSVVLRFWEPAEYIDHETVGIYVGVLRTERNITSSGAVSTYVNIRNLTK